MSRIISYPYDNDIKDADAWIGSEASTTRTKQYTAEAVANYLNINGKISIGGQMTYEYVQNPLQEAGTFSITSGGLDNVPFANISALTLSITDKGGQNVVAFLNYLVGSDILISKQNEVSSFGHYEVVSYSVNSTDPAFYDLVVTVKGSNGSMNFLDIYEAVNFTLASEIVGAYTFNVDSDNGTATTIQNNDTIDFGSSNITVSNVGSAISFNLPVTGVIAGAYTTANITVDAFGRVTAAASGTSGPGGSGTTNFVTKWNNGNTLGNSIVFDNGTNVGIGTTSPSSKLHVEGTLQVKETSPINEEPNGSRIIAAIDSRGGSDTGGLGIFTGDDNNDEPALLVTNYLDTEVLRISGTEGNIITSGKVGIGTTSPGDKLHVSAGAIRLDNFYQLRWGGTGTGIYGHSTQGLNLYTDTGTTRLKIEDGGNVGIGTTSPSAKLHVVGASFKLVDTTTHQRLFVTSGDSSQSIIYLGDENDTTKGRVAYNNASDSLYFNTDGSTKLLITSAGNIGIGTTAPARKLYVNGIQGWAVDNLEMAYLNPTTTGVDFALKNSSGTGVIRLDGRPNQNSYINNGTGNVGIGTASPGQKLDVNGNIGYTASNAIYPRRKSVAADWYVSKFDGGVNIDNSIGSSGDTAFRVGYWGGGTFAPNIKLSAGGNNSSYIASGNVGIGTTSPKASLQIGFDVSTSSEKLDVRGNSSGNYIASFEQDHVTGYGVLIDTDGTLVSEPALEVKNSSSNLFYVGSNGNVGIGTTSPAYNLDVQGGSNGMIRAYGTSIARLSLQNNSRHFSTSVQGTNWLLYDETGGAEVLRITSAGNVGIGTTSPGQKLHVDGNIRVGNSADVIFSNKLYGLSTGDLTIFTSGNTLLTQTGNVGIGTTSPNAKLTVKGSLLASEDLFHIEDSGGVRMIEVASDPAGNASLQVKDTSGSTKSLINSAGNTYLTGGNVGIGTTSPGEKLHVDGNIKINQYVKLTNNSGGLLDLNGNAVLYSNYSGGETKINSYAADGFISFYSGDNTNGGNNERVRIDGDGNVGIGTTTPNAKLQVNGANGSSPLMSIKNTSTSTANDSVLSFNRDNSDSLGYSIGINSADDSFNVSGVGDGINNTIRLKILSNGNTGIGTTNPQTTLDVNGPIKVGTAQTLAASSSTVGAIRYRAGTGFSYMEMVMQTGVSGATPIFAWVIVKENTW